GVPGEFDSRALPPTHPVFTAASAKRRSPSPECLHCKRPLRQRCGNDLYEVMLDRIRRMKWRSSPSTRSTTRGATTVRRRRSPSLLGTRREVGVENEKRG